MSSYIAQRNENNVTDQLIQNVWTKQKQQVKMKLHY